MVVAALEAGLSAVLVLLLEPHKPILTSLDNGGVAASLRLNV